MLKLLVIADDFTGALDTGVQFSKQGAKTLVTTDTDIEYNRVDESVEVLVMDTETRYLSFEDAYRKIKNIVVKAKQSSIPFIYKKVDSALRGNISAEIKAILDVGQEMIIPFLPAYPEMNRVLIDGNLYIDHVLVSQSVFSEDPYEPVTESNVLKRLKQEADIESELVKGDLIPINVNGILVFDSQTDEEMERQMTALENANLLSISIGCAGFAKILAKQLFPDRSPIRYSLKNPLVVICGSMNPITRKQIEYAEKKNRPRISLKPHQLLYPDYWLSSEGKEEIQSYLDLMEKHPLIIFETLSDETTAGIVVHRETENLPISEYRFRIGKSLGALTQSLWERHSKDTFLFTGGDTLFQSMEVLGINEIRPIAEISAGVVVSTIEWNQQERKVITKSGGFGNEELFENISLLTKNNKEEEICL